MDTRVVIKTVEGENAHLSVEEVFRGTLEECYDFVSESSGELLILSEDESKNWMEQDEIAAQSAYDYDFSLDHWE